MATIWRKSGGQWSPLTPAAFGDEAALHDLIADAPHLLPLAGSPELILLGREVYLGNGAVDLLAVEPDGRITVIEIKLAKNSEARRAVVAQTLAYAAFLKGLEPEQLESGPLARHLRTSLVEHVKERADPAAFDPDEFASGLRENLQTGFFRLVMVLDDVPPELERLVGYLTSITRDGLVIDLIRVQAFNVAGEQVVVPVRVEPERESPPEPARTLRNKRPSPPTVKTPGIEAFRNAAEQAVPNLSESALLFFRWAESLESRGLTRLLTTEGQVNTTLQVPLNSGNLKPIIAWCHQDRLELTVRTAVLELLRQDDRHALESLAQTALRTAPSGYDWTWDLAETPAELLTILERAYAAEA